jgi:PAS domain S-box-containing protein
MPMPIIEMYGRREQEPYVVDTVVGVDAIYVPVDVAFQRIKARAWGTFFGMTALLSLLVLMIYSLFNVMVTSELKGLLVTFRKIINKNTSTESEDDLDPSDEIDQLKHAFENVADDLGKAHMELSASEGKFRVLFENSRDPIIISDLDLRIVDINSAGINLFGFHDRQEALSIETIKQLFWDARDVSTILEAIERDGFIKDFEVSMVNRYGDRLDILATLNQRLDDQGFPQGFEGGLRDITRKKQFDKQMARTEKLAAIGQFAAGVAHEINNPLSVIECYSNLVLKGVGPETQACQDAEIIKKHTANCKKIMEGLLKFARVGETQPSKINIHVGLEDVLEILEPQMIKNGITIKREYEDTLPALVLDQDKMKQVYMNLLMNANQAISDGGEIGVRTGLSENGDWLKIEIYDTGCGIPPKTLDMIFDPFFTTKEVGQGTGLGLSISYGIIKEHGGTIKVDSREKNGSVFTIELPLNQKDTGDVK